MKVSELRWSLTCTCCYLMFFGCTGGGTNTGKNKSSKITEMSSLSHQSREEMLASHTHTHTLPKRHAHTSHGGARPTFETQKLPDVVRRNGGRGKHVPRVHVMNPLQQTGQQQMETTLPEAVRARAGKKQ